MNSQAALNFLTLVLMLAIVAISGLAAADVPAKPTFTKDVLPILQANCQDCHRPKPLNVSGMVAPFGLTTYKEVRPWAKAIAKAITTGKMPPWFATKHFDGVFRNERRLSGDEIATITKWVEQGAVRGNPDDAPEPLVFPETEWWLGEPDLIVPLPEPVWVGDDVEDWQPNINLSISEEQLPADRWIRSLEAQAGSEPVHHIVVFSTHPDDARGSQFGGTNLGGLAPGAEPSIGLEGYGRLLRKDTTLRVSMHYHKEAGPGTGVWDQSRLGFFFYPEDAEVEAIVIEPIGSMDFEVPPQTAEWMVGMAKTFETPFRIHSMLPHMHLRGVAAQFKAFYPDGTTEMLLDVPEYDYNWQLSYEYPEPREFPEGTRIEVRIKYDNSEGNPNNPDPLRAVGFGLETTDEMAFGWMSYSWNNNTPDDTASDD